MAAAVAPNGMVALSSVRVSHTGVGGVIHLMKAATASLSEASEGDEAISPARSHAPKKTAPTG